MQKTQHIPEIFLRAGVQDLSPKIHDFKEMSKIKQIIIMCVSTTGEEVLDALRNNMLIEPACFCDSNKEKQNTYFHGLNVYSLEEAIAQYGAENCFFIIATPRPIYINDIKQQLINKGVAVTDILMIFELMTWNLLNQAINKLPTKPIKKENTPITVCFFIVLEAFWKVDTLYHLLDQDPRYNPVIIVCPKIGHSEKESQRLLNNCYNFFYKRGYNVINTQQSDGEWLDVRNVIQPDVAFFQTPHSFTLTQYTYHNFSDILTCYVPYYHQTDNGWETQWSSFFHLSMWRLFYIHEYHQRLAVSKMENQATNVQIVGYPATEKLYDNVEKKENIWKPLNFETIKIIWAPHQFINNELNPLWGTSEFLHTASLMKELAITYNDRIQIAFKPHPVLKGNLYHDSDWGKAKTDEYYQFWATQPNTQLEEGDYINLFVTSDAMIHDCGSFLAEYLYVNKPVLYLVNDTTTERFNSYALECLDVCYQGKTSESILQFITELLAGEDPMKEMRTEFVNRVLIDRTKELPSRQIYNELSKVFFNTIK